MNAVYLQQTSTHLTRQVRRWDRRRRTIMSSLWVVRALTLGLLVGVTIAVIARLRPWLLPEQIAAITGLVTAAALLLTLGAIWFWPRSLARAARYFDRRFALKERVSTALELTSGTIPIPDRLVERQLSDALGAAQKANGSLGELMPLFVIPAREIVLVIALAGLFAYLVLTDNPKTQDLLAQRELEQAIAEQVENLEEEIARVEENEALTEAEKEALTNPLAEARDILSQPDITQQEAMAALSQAEQSLRDMADGMPPSQEAAYRQAAGELAQSELTADLAEAFQEPNLNAAADAMDELAEDVAQNNLSEEQRSELADRLEAAADAVEQNNPALAEKLREAADALRRGDMQAAQKALREAAEMMRKQQQQLENSELAQAAQQAQQQVSEGQQQLSEAGQPSNTDSQPLEQAPGESQIGAQDQSQQPSGSDSQTGDQAGEGQPMQGEQVQQSGQPGDGQQAGSQGQQAESGSGGETGADNSTGGAGEGENQGGSPAEGQESPDGAAATGADSQQQGGGEGGVNAPSAGSGAGGEGVDDTGGQVVEGQGEISTDGPAGDSGGNPQAYESDNPSSTIGGESETTLDIGGSDPNGAPMQEGEFGPNPSGESSMSYTNVFNQYRDIISNALESGRIPLDQRDVIHDYFSSLEP